MIKRMARAFPLLLLLIASASPALAVSGEAAGYNRTGLSSLDSGDFASAYAGFSSAIEADELYAEAYVNRALSLLRMENSSAALVDVNEAINLYTNGDLCEEINNGDYALAEYLQNVMDEIWDINNSEDSALAVDFSFTSSGDNSGVSSSSSDSTDSSGSDSASVTVTDSGDDSSVTLSNASTVTSDGTTSTAADVSTSGDDRRARIQDLNEQIAEEITLINSCALVSVLNQEGLTRAYYIRALALTEEGDYSAAIEDFNRLIEMSPDNAMLYAGRGEAYLGLGAHDLALSDLNTALTLAPQTPEVLVAMGDYWAYMANYDLALEYYGKALEYSPGYSPAYNAMGLVYMDLTDYDAAIAAFNSSIQYNPYSPKSYDYRGDAWTAEAARATDAGQSDRASDASRYAAEDYARADELEAAYSSASASSSSSYWENVFNL